MSDGLRIDTDVVNSSGTGINTSGSNFQDEVNGFKSHVDNILNYWSGADADAFRDVANEVAELLDRASVKIQDVGSHLVKTATVMDETVAENQTNIGRI